MKQFGIQLYVVLIALMATSAALTSCEDEDDDIDNQINTEIDDTVITEGVFEDTRDGKSYNVILQNGLWWMIENFGYEYEGSNSTSSYWTGAMADYNGDGFFDEQAVYTYYDNRVHPPAQGDDENGLLYTYDAAVNAAPSGWRLPTYNEYIDFFQGGSNSEAERYSYENVHTSAFTEIKAGSAPQLLGLTYGQHGGPRIWSSTLHTQNYPDGDDRDSYKLIPAANIWSGAHYNGHTVRYVTEEYNFTP